MPFLDPTSDASLWSCTVCVPSSFFVGSFSARRQCVDSYEGFCARKSSSVWLGAMTRSPSALRDSAKSSASSGMDQPRLL